MTTRPHANDVLLGKGTAINNHRGNKHFRALVEVQKQKFSCSKRSEKREIANNIMNEIRRLGGRFLMEDPDTKKQKPSSTKSINGGSTGVNHRVLVNKSELNSGCDSVEDPFILEKVWVCADHDKAMNKVMHRLREKRTFAEQTITPKDSSVSKPQQLDLKSQETPAATEIKSGAQPGVGSSVQQHCSNNEATSHTRSSVTSNVHASIPGSIQTTVPSVARKDPISQGIARIPAKMQSRLPLAKRISAMENLASGNASELNPDRGDIMRTGTQFMHPQFDGLNHERGTDFGPSIQQQFKTGQELIGQARSNLASINQAPIQGSLLSTLQSADRPIPWQGFVHGIPANIQSVPPFTAAPNFAMESLSRAASSSINNSHVSDVELKTGNELLYPSTGPLLQYGRDSSFQQQFRTEHEFLSQASTNHAPIEGGLLSTLQSAARHTPIGQGLNYYDRVPTANSQSNLPELAAHISFLESLACAKASPYPSAKQDGTKTEVQGIYQKSGSSLNTTEVSRETRSIQQHYKTEQDLTGQTRSSFAQPRIPGIFQSTLELGIPEATIQPHLMPLAAHPLAAESNAHAVSFRSELDTTQEDKVKMFDQLIGQQYKTSEDLFLRARSTASMARSPMPDSQPTFLPTQDLARAAIPTRIQATVPSIATHSLVLENLASDTTLAHISINHWIKSTLALSPSTNDYVKSAVDLSLVLTKHLMQLIAFDRVVLTDISAEKFVIFVEPPTMVKSSSCLTIKGIEYQSRAPTNLSMSQARNGSPVLSPRSFCSALGNIFLLIFSQGQSSHQDALPLVKKRKLLVPTSGSSVTHLLHEIGMPLSIRQLVCDLIDATKEPCPDSALTSLEEVASDLTLMKDEPQRYLFDRTPQKALEDTCLFENASSPMIGREKEIQALMTAKKNISIYVGMDDEVSLAERRLDDEKISFRRGDNFTCEFAFLSGYAGSGKSTLLFDLMRTCREEGWLVMHCKFDKSSASSISPLTDAFARDLDSDMKKTLQEGFRSILSTIDREGIVLLCEVIPSLSDIFPEITSTANNHIRSKGASSIDKVGSTGKRLKYLILVLQEAVCSLGLPVLWALDDIQYAPNRVLDDMQDFALNYLEDSSTLLKGSSHKGMLVVSAFRSDEAGDNDTISKTIASIEQSKRAKVTKITVGGLEHEDISKLIAGKLCLPVRYTQKLAGLVLNKTRGNPFFLIQFLKTIIQNKMLEYSLQSKSWIWDNDVIDMQMISEGVAQLLKTNINKLPLHLQQAAIIASCFGSQIDDSTVDILNSNAGQQLLRINLKDALQILTKMSIMETAGPIHAFTHDLIQTAVYETIPASERKTLHRTIGSILLRSAASNPATHLLAVRQINKYCKNNDISQEERSQFSEINATAAKFSIAASSFEEARTFIDIGIQLLGPQHWENQYPLSLKLYEMSALISCFNGDVAAMSSTLTETIANVKTFEDSLTSSSLLSKLLAASSKFSEAISNSLSILSALGEDFPEDVTLQMVSDELSVIQTTLANISVDHIKNLPLMTDGSKLNAMKFLSMLCSYSIMAKPLLVPILGCRMVRLTIEHGFCDDSIVGLVTTGYALFSFTDDVQLGYRIGKVGDLLIEESPNRHALRSRLAHELDGTLKAMIEPQHSVLSLLPDRYNSAMLTGDIGTALQCHRLYCVGSFFTGANLLNLTKQFVTCIKQSIKYQQNALLYSSMSAFGVCMHLAGQDVRDEVDVKSYNELNEIGLRTGNKGLLYQNFLNEMTLHFFMGHFMKVVDLAENFKPTGQKRITEINRIFVVGISSLILARHTHELKFRNLGEKAVEKMLKWESISKRNFGHYSKLLQAELHYLNGGIESAKAFYEASIVSASELKFLHVESLAYELYGTFLLENHLMEKGLDQLQLALKKYEQWGAMKKVTDLRLFVETMDPSYFRNFKKITPL